MWGSNGSDRLARCWSERVPLKLRGGTAGGGCELVSAICSVAEGRTEWLGEGMEQRMVGSSGRWLEAALGRLGTVCSVAGSTVT